MAKYNNSKLFWLQLKEDFFDNDTIKWIEEQENGMVYSNFYLKLCLKSLKYNGVLIRKVGDIFIPYNTKMLAELTGCSIDTVSVAMQMFIKIGLVNILEDGAIFMTNIQNMIGCKTVSGEKKKLQRNDEKIVKKVAGGQMSTPVSTLGVDKCPPQCPPSVHPGGGQMSTREKRIENKAINIKEKENKEKDFLSLSEKLQLFKGTFCGKPTKLTIKQEELLAAIDMRRLIEKIKESDFLIKSNNLGLGWCLEHSDEILSDNWKNYVKRRNSSWLDGQIESSVDYADYADGFIKFTDNN